MREEEGQEIKVWLMATCPVCGVKVFLRPDTKGSEVVICGECESSLVVGEYQTIRFFLKPAPKIEEDWGE